MSATLDLAPLLSTTPLPVLSVHWEVQKQADGWYVLLRNGKEAGRGAWDRCLLEAFRRGRDFDFITTGAAIVCVPLGGFRDVWNQAARLGGTWGLVVEGPSS